MNNTIYTVKYTAPIGNQTPLIHSCREDNITLCGKLAMHNWDIITINFDGNPTCPECLKGEAKLHKDIAPKVKIMTKLDYMKMIERDAKEYVKKGVLKSIIRSRHMNKIKSTSVRKFAKIIPQRVFNMLSDAILVDFINYLGYKQGLDYGMYTYDLRSKRK